MKKEIKSKIREQWHNDYHEEHTSVGLHRSILICEKSVSKNRRPKLSASLWGAVSIAASTTERISSTSSVATLWLWRASIRTCLHPHPRKSPHSTVWTSLTCRRTFKHTVHTQTYLMNTIYSQQMQQVASCGGKTCSVHKYLQVSATLKSIDYNVATTFILNNNNNNKRSK